MSALIPALSRRVFLGALPLAVCGGGLLGVLILAASGASLKWLVVLTAVGCLPALLFVFGSVTRLFQALLVFALSMTLDIFPGFSDRFVETRPGIPVSLTAILLLSLFSLSLIERTSRPLAVSRRAGATYTFALLIVWAALSWFVAPRPAYVLQALPGYVTSFLLYLYAQRLMTSPDTIRFTVRWVAIGVLVSGVLACVQYVTGGYPSLTLLGGSDSQFVQEYGQEQLSRVSGLLHHPNTLAVYLNGFLPLLLILSFTIRETRPRQLCRAAFGFGALALLFTYSRGGWLSFGVSLALLAVVVPKKNLRLTLSTAFAATICLALLVVLLFSTPLYSRVVTRLGGDDEGAAGSRLPLARASAALIAQHPVTGVGLGNYQYASPLVSDDRGVQLMGPSDGLPMRVHNLFLLAAAELGLPGVSLLGMTVVLFLVRGVSAVRHSSGLQSQVGLGLMCGLIAVLTHSMMEPATLADPSYFVLSFVGGCVTGLAGRPTTDA